MCKNCEALGKSIPLQWIPQYQRWYCYECEQYATSSTSLKQAKDADKEESREDLEDEHDEEEEVVTGAYTLGLARGSRIDGFCFGCRHLIFTQNNAHLRCEMNIPRYLEPALPDVTIRPTGAGKGISGICGQMETVSENQVLNLMQWQEYFQKQIEKQIRSHEKDVVPIEMYRIEFLGENTADLGVNVVPIQVSRDNITGGRFIILVDALAKKVWVHAGNEKSGFMVGFAKLIGGFAGSMEDIFSPICVRDMLKRNVESFAVDRIWLGEEPSEFWETIDKGAGQPLPETLHEKPQQVEYEGVRIEMYELKYHTARSYGEYYTGGRSSSDSKSITLEPIETSIEELQNKRIVAVVDHQTKIVWEWIGSKSSRFQRFFIKQVPSIRSSRNLHLDIIGARIGQDIRNYDYVVVEQDKEPDQFRRIFKQ
jgi:hypothetical protein